MDLKAVAPELRGRARLLPRPPLERRAALHLARAAVRLMPARHSAGARFADVVADGVPARLYRSRGPAASAGLLWIHGGGFVMGDLAQDHGWCLRASAALGITILSTNYRLAPEHPFPAALDDVTTAWRWLRERAPGLGLDRSRLAIGGLSAGGGLAASLGQRLRDEDGPQPTAQWLFAPMLDDRTAGRRELDAGREIGWDNESNRFGWRAYLGHEPGSPAQPAGAVPARRTNVTGLPPAYLAVGDIDLFCDEDVAYAERLAGAGVPVSMDVVPGAPHGFQTWAPASAAAVGLAHKSIAWLGDALR